MNSISPELCKAIERLRATTAYERLIERACEKGLL